MPKVLFVLGGPGSGKGTTCALIAKTLNFEHVSLGEVVRNYITDNPTTERTTRYKQILTEGKLLPCEEITQILLEHIADKGTEKGLLIDGYPRSIDQLNIYVNRTKKTLTEQTNLYMLYMNTPDDVMKERVYGRARDVNDTNIEVVDHRLLDYYNLTMPVIEQIKTEIPDKVLELSGLNHLEDNVKLFEKYVIE